jgi:hypothetical protein
MESDDVQTVKALVQGAKSRVKRRTFIQDCTEPLTGRVDERKIAAKFNNLEHAVDELATAVELVAEECREQKSA